jgi:hypothetical protein
VHLFRRCLVSQQPCPMAVIQPPSTLQLLHRHSSPSNNSRWTIFHCNTHSRINAIKMSTRSTCVCIVIAIRRHRFLATLGTFFSPPHHGQYTSRLAPIIGRSGKEFRRRDTVSVIRRSLITVSGSLRRIWPRGTKVIYEQIIQPECLNRK